MKLRVFVYLLVFAVAFSACQRNTVSKIPHITLIAFIPLDSMRVNVDIDSIVFSIVDGDADIGNDTVSLIYIKDSRYDSAGFVPTPFPQIADKVEDPTKGLQATCTIYPFPPTAPRPDSLHKAMGDTLTYQFYITDRANHKSNIITTHPLIVRP